jgi:glycosyltransferase involved in cell wall biosynthesis
VSPLVAIVLHEPAVGGATTAVLRALPILREEGWRFVFWVPRPGAVADLLEGQGERVMGERRDLRYSWRALREPPGLSRRACGVAGYLRRFGSFVARERPDVVHANTIVTLPEALAARRQGAATLLHVHEMLGTGVRAAAATRMARLVDGVACVSHACAAPLRERGVPAGIVTAGVADPPLPPTTGAMTARRPLVVGTLATVCHRKGSDLFVAAAELLSHRGGDVEFRLVGPLAPGSDRAWAQAVVDRAARAGVRVSVTTDAMSELREWDVFVLPTRRDPFPLVVLEAMAAGLPVVAARVDGVAEQVDAQSGVLVAPDDAPALAAAIGELLDDPVRRAAMGAAAARRVAACFTPRRNADELACAYEQAITVAAARRRRRATASSTTSRSFRDPSQQRRGNAPKAASVRKAPSARGAAA